MAATKEVGKPGQFPRRRDHAQPWGCTVCRTVKPPSVFDWKRRERGQRQGVCRDCRRENSAVRQRANADLLRELKSSPCADCGNTFPPGLASGSGGRPTNRERILEEAAKCDVVCANCHAIRTYTRSEQRHGQ